MMKNEALVGRNRITFTSQTPFSTTISLEKKKKKASLNSSPCLSKSPNQHQPTISFHPITPKSKPFPTQIQQSMGSYDYRSKSTGIDHGDMQIQPYTGPPDISGNFNDSEKTKGKNKKKSSSGKKGCFSDPELQRKKRVASYKMYSVEGKVKGTFRKSLRWLKSKCAKVVGWW